MQSRVKQGRRLNLKLKDTISINRTRSLAIIVVFAVLGAIFLLTTRASVGTNAVEPESGLKSGGASLVTGSTNASGSGYLRFGQASSLNNKTRRFFADSASWNQPVSVYGRSTALEPYADRFWNYAGLPAAPGDTNVQFKAYSVPFYDVTEANTSVRLFQAIWAQNQQGFSTSGNAIGDSIPWNNNWKPGIGNDRIMQIVNYDTGYQYGLWVVGEPSAACDDRNPFGIAAFDGPNTKAGYVPGRADHLCIAAYGQYGGLYTTTDGTTHTDRGMGIDKLALVTRAEEVKSGAIRHALELTVTSTMFGLPECSPNKGASAPGAGTSCGFYLPPATRVEFTSNQADLTANRCPGNPITVDSTTRSKTVPEGMRIALNITDGDITAWLNQRGYTGAKRETARVFAVALRDYGAIIGETGCYGIGIETDGIMNPTSAATWAELGITDITGNDNPHGDLLDGLFTRQRLYIVNPPNL